MRFFLAEHEKAIQEAAARVHPYVRRTPLLDTDLDPGLLIKPECLQVTGSFKARGAFNAVLHLAEQGRAGAGVIAISSGNHAQAVALAARTAGLPALILIPEGSNPAKAAATRALGAEVIDRGVTFDNRDRVLAEMTEARGLTLVHPFDDWDVIHGQGTACAEVLDQRPEVGLVVAPIGGGGLIAGTALMAKSHDPSRRVIAVEPELADDASRSFRSGRLERMAAYPKTIADGVRSTAIGQRNFEVIVERRLVDDVVTVSEQEIADALVVAWTRLKLAVEPTGALPLAAYLAGKLPPPDPLRPTVLVLSGGNFSVELVSSLLASRTAAAD